jgi:uncharacterized protein (TIGR03435 family)
MKLGFLIVLFLLVLLPVRTLGAQAADSKITFEVASVKPAGPFVPGDLPWMGGGPGTADPGRVTFHGEPLAFLLRQAYDVLPDQISGPDWISGGRYYYDITATMPAGITRERFRIMLQTLLAERFHLRLHHETQTRPGYELAVAEGGPKVKNWAPATDAATFKPGIDQRGFPRLNPSAESGLAFTFPPAGQVARMAFRNSMAVFCQVLGNEINAAGGAPTGGQAPRVIDDTGLTGVYDFTLEFASTLVMPGISSSVPAADNGATPIASDPGQGGPNIFTAVEKQLGLKLVKVKEVPVDVLIVDNADKVPTEN